MSSSSDGRSDGPLGLDIRTPMGAFFTIVGLVLASYGMIADGEIYRRSLGYNVNFWWGVALFIFGALLLWLGRRR